jgi:hypothetical protein
MGRKKSRRQKGGTEAKPRQKTKNQRIKQKKTQKREGKVKEQHREEDWLCNYFRPCRQRKTQNQNQFKAGRPLHHLLSFKVAEKTKGTCRQVSAEGRQREAAGEDPSAL